MSVGIGFNEFFSYSINMNFNMTETKSELNNVHILIRPLIKISILIGFLFVPTIIILMSYCFFSSCYKDVKETYEDIEMGNVKKDY